MAQPYREGMGRALVTGATAGIGNSFARALAARGHEVTLVSRDEARLREVADQIGNGAEVLSADLTDPADLAKVAEAAREADILINNAGSSIKGWFGTTDIADEDHQLDLLVRAPMHLMDAFIKAHRGTGGDIINVASVAAFTPRGAYSAHKAWLVSLSRGAQVQYASEGFRIMALCPGFVHTEFHQRMGADMSGIPEWMWLNADATVAEALDDFRAGKVLSVPSLRYKVLVAAARCAPSAFVARLAQRGR